MAYIDIGSIRLPTSSTLAPVKINVPTSIKLSKAKKKGLAIAAAKKAAALMRKGEKLDAAWAKAGGEQDVLAKIKALKVPGLGSVSSSDLTEIANAAISTMKSVLGPRKTPTITKASYIPKVNVPQKTDAGLYEVTNELQEESSKTALLLAGVGGLGLLALVLMKKGK